MKISRIIHAGVEYECRASTVAYSDALGRKVDLRFYRGELSVAYLGVICAIDSPDYSKYASLADDDLASVALEKFVSGQLGMDIAAVFRSTQQLQEAGRVAHPVSLLVPMTAPSNNRLQRSGEG